MLQVKPKQPLSMIANSTFHFSIQADLQDGTSNPEIGECTINSHTEMKPMGSANSMWELQSGHPRPRSFSTIACTGPRDTPCPMCHSPRAVAYGHCYSGNYIQILKYSYTEAGG